MCEFLRLSGLEALVGASYGSQRGLGVALEAAALAYAEEQRACLAVGMARRQITVCEDETYHPEICLVALERSRGSSWRSVTSAMTSSESSWPNCPAPMAPSVRSPIPPSLLCPP